MSIKLRKISKGFPLSKHKKIQILKNINLNIHTGDMIALVGKNGSGKTTLLRVIAERIFPDSGKVSYENHCSNNLVSFVSSNERSFFFNLTVKSNLDFFIKKTNKKLLEDLKVAHLINRKFSSLSNGEKKKFMIIRSILKGGKILILDEFTNSLDLTTKIEIYKLLKKLLKEKIIISIIFATHDIYEVLSLSNKCVLLNNGQLTDEVKITNSTSENEIKYLMLQ